MKRMERAKSYLEELKEEIQLHIDSGKYSKFIADNEGVTPQQRLEWTPPSIDYINGVADTLDAEMIESKLREHSYDDMRTLAFDYIAFVQDISKDQYVKEGRRNIALAFDVMARFSRGELPEAEPEPVEKYGEVPEAEKQSLFSQAAGFFKKKFGKKSVETVDPERVLENPNASCEELTVALALTKKRADEAEAKVAELKAMLKEFGVDT